MASSATGDLLASAGDDGTVRLWDARTGEPLSTLKGHTGAVLGVAFSATGELLASAGDDRTVRLWDARTGEPLSTLKGHTGAVLGVAFSATGELLASAGDDRAVRLYRIPQSSRARWIRWPLRPQRPTVSLVGHTAAVNAVAFSPDRDLVAGAGDDHTLRIWDLEGHPLSCIRLGGPVRTVAWMRDLIAIGVDNDVVALDVTDDGHHAAVTSRRDGSSQAIDPGRIIPSPPKRRRRWMLAAKRAPTRDKGDYHGCIPSDADGIMRSMSTTSTARRARLVLVEPAPWYAAAPSSALERRRELEDQRSRLLALAVGDHLPIELAQRAADLTAQLEQGA